MMRTKTKLDDVLETTAKSMGVEYVGCERQGISGHKTLLRVYIEKQDGKLTVDDCARVSRQIQAVLMVEQVLPGEFMLEVSSPGLERTLFILEHFQRYLGHKVKLKLSQPINGQRNFVGVLQVADPQKVVLTVEQQEIAVPFSAIEKANLVVDYK